ncbi:hypothetical protein SLEP1_g55824 [Rubroshorea leprosula]|uniref:non-specific serine/threonine protein kinase n=1 Tax=Rubroshorea leprosula TaxID=152421 RepID=A0AAV5MHR4_9ROSI|nr:hypothetical protein SLEP1_g55824 [Rubroshorea leprosula]
MSTTVTERIKEKKENDIKNEGQDEDMELPVFQLATISHATDNFSLSNKLGQGGFGPVYKGKLVDGQEIAVKRLSLSSRQGVNEFKNEVKLIAKLQHRNLVRLLGCCIEGEEKMLVYEYMPNKSLDSFIFDQTRGKELDWSKRFRIICGIARGLLYLHQDSRLRIIHRDLKPSNVLLDKEMNPKISDFGMAKTFGGEQTEGSTRRVVGTYPGSSRNRYLGIWYKKIPVRTVVWVANRLNPINYSSAVLTIKKTGELQLLTKDVAAVWSVNLTREARNPTLQLLNSGNLVLIDLRIELHGNPELVMREGSQEYYRGGPYNGQRFSDTEISGLNAVAMTIFVFNEEEVYTSYSLKNKSLIPRVFLNQTDYTSQRYIWGEDTQTWNLYSYMPRDFCNIYGRCGAYSYCDNTQLPPCQCLKGFEPKFPSKWSSMDWSQGCVRKKLLNCQQGDGFIQYQKLKLPDAAQSWISRSMNPKECPTKCLQNCSCTAYTSFDINGDDSGCAIWFGDLLDIRQFQIGGQGLYVRMSASESEESKKKSKMKIALMLAIPLAVLSRVFIVCYFFLKRKRSLEERREDKGEYYNKVQKEDMELPVFELAIRSHATNNFSLTNKLGQWWFGLVYKILAWPKLAVETRLKETLTELLELSNDYMAPKQAVDEFFSLKSDVFSFGVLLMEIVSGTKNRGMYHSNHSINLNGHTPEDRPTMSSVLLMLGSEIELPEPKEPGFLLEKTSLYQILY